MLCLSGLLGRLGGELGGVAVLMFCMEPGGEEWRESDGGGASSERGHRRLLPSAMVRFHTGKLVHHLIFEGV